MKGFEWKLTIRKYSPAQPRDERGRWTDWGTGRGPLTAKFKEAAPEDFRAALDKNLSERYAAFVTKYSPQEYAEMGARTYLMEGGKTGFAIKPDGDIISVFSNDGGGRAAIQAAVEFGGRKLDCFDGFLPRFYKRFGFQEYDRWQWDDRYAPADWRAEDGKPDVVLMRREHAGQ